MPCCYSDGERTPLEDWVAQYDEEAVDVDIAILDPHHHLWDPVNHDKGWPIPKCVIRFASKLGPRKFGNLMVRMNGMARFSFGERSPSAAVYLGPQLKADHKGPDGKGHNVVGTVYIESMWETPGVEKCMAPYGDVTMAAQVNSEFPSLCVGIVPHADLLLGAKVEPLLKRYQEHPLVKGVRFQLMWNANKLFWRSLDPGFGEHTMSDAKFREAFGLLAKYGLVFDACVYHTHLSELATLARDFPEQTIILDHLGYALGVGGYKMEETYPKWQAAMKEVAQCPNVHLKVGGLGSRFFGFGFDERLKPPTSDELAEKWGRFVLFGIETFGVDRCLMESNFPVDKVSSSYTVLFNALKKIVRGYSMEDRKKLFEHNARKVYKL